MHPDAYVKDLALEHRVVQHVHEGELVRNCALQGATAAPQACTHGPGLFHQIRFRQPCAWTRPYAVQFNFPIVSPLAIEELQLTIVSVCTIAQPSYTLYIIPPSCKTPPNCGKAHQH